MLNKIFLVILICGTRLLTTGVKRSDSRSFAADSLTAIQNIRKQFDLINFKLSAYTLLERDLMGESAEGGAMMGFYQVAELRKLTVKYYGETGKSTVDYYFDHGKLIFAFSRIYQYNKPISEPGFKIVSVRDGRYYFTTKGMVLWLEGSRPQNPNAASFKETESRLLVQAKRWLSIKNNCNVIPVSSHHPDTIRCKFFSDCPSTGYIIKGTRNICGSARHVNPRNKKVALEQGGI